MDIEQARSGVAGTVEMAGPLRIEYEGAFYHVTSRRNERKETFCVPVDDKKDWHKNGGPKNDIKI